jgi:hypothetical protein
MVKHTLHKVPCFECVSFHSQLSTWPCTMYSSVILAKVDEKIASIVIQLHSVILDYHLLHKQILQPSSSYYGYKNDLLITFPVVMSMRTSFIYMIFSNNE